MKNPVEQIENIKNIDDFLTFVVELAMNAKEHPEEWANTTITDYLGQMASWVDDSYPFEHNIDWDKVDYKTLQKYYIWERYTSKMFGKFKIKGNRAHLRSEEELVNVDKAEADDAFKKYKQTILDKYLAEKGFVKYKANAYVRKNKIDVLEYIDLQKERYGSKTFTVNYAIMPLYVPHDYLITGFGSRLGKLICDKDIWWDYANDSIAQVSFQNVADAVERFVMPWFDKYAIEDVLMKKLMEDKKKREQTGMGIPYKNEEWISSLKEDKARANIIGENIDRLKLPKKWNVPNSIPDIHLLDLSLK